MSTPTPELAAIGLGAGPVCDAADCDRTDTQPAIIDIYDDEGGPVSRTSRDVCPEHVKRLIAAVNGGEDA